MPKVSVVIPTYNRPKLLRRAVQSVLDQSYEDYEILIVKNGPLSDNLLDVKNLCLRDKKPIEIIYERKAHPVTARNAGIRMALGEFVAILEDDDVWLPEKLAKQVAVIESSSNIGVVTCNSYECNADGIIMKERPFTSLPCNFKNFVEHEMVDLISSLSGTLIRRSLFEEIGFFDKTYFISSDVKFYLEVSRQYEFKTIREPLFHYYIHGDNLSLNFIQGRLEVVSILKALDPSVAHGISKKDIQKAIHHLCVKNYRRGITLYNQKNYRGASKAFWAALHEDPWVGCYVPWSRFSNPLYRFLRAYVKTLQSTILSLGKRKN